MGRYWGLPWYQLRRINLALRWLDLRGHPQRWQEALWLADQVLQRARDGLRPLPLLVPGALRPFTFFFLLVRDAPPPSIICYLLGTQARVLPLELLRIVGRFLC